MHDIYDKCKKNCIEEKGELLELLCKLCIGKKWVKNETNLQGKVVGIAMMDAFFHRFDADHGQNGSKGLLPCYSHIGSDMVNEDGPDQVSFSPPFLP